MTIVSCLVVGTDDFIFALKQTSCSSTKCAAEAHAELSFEMKIKAAYAALGLPVGIIFMTV